MKQRKPARTLLVVFIIFIVGIFIVSKMSDSNKTRYSFKNRGYAGCSFFYDLLKELDYDVTYDLKPVHKIDTDRLVVLNMSYVLYKLDLDEIEQYANRGGKILIVSDYSPFPTSGKKVLSNPLNIWEMDNGGVLICGDVDYFNNIVVTQNRERTYDILTYLHPYMDEHGVVFNEFYLFYETDGKHTLWTDTPQEIKFVLLYAAIVIWLFLWKKGKRFGSPKVLYEEAEPDEHQYAKAVGSLYFGAKHWETLLPYYYNNFIQKLQLQYILFGETNSGNWITTWENQVGKDNKTARKVFREMEQIQAEKAQGRKIKNKRIKALLLNIQELETILDKENSLKNEWE